ncbi:hypothetical protein C8F04DRAFT_1088150 [Mycena alexandri]|uniref:Zn(2)-C6 fungal-type domain-containing protein n=1 Tax=Mycena alexandri TaxID=1745969 RepID=A0AAD6T736_9AGAR|nr:hypothetical protein C8F04DRAFT_1088150 [Mycena alexandri]
MSAPRVRQKRLKKPPACDSCKAKRVLCHPQPNGLPCPRCAEKNTICITTPVSRRRPRVESESAVEKGERSLAELAMFQRLPPAPSSSVALIPTAQVCFTSQDCPELTPELVAHFFDCFFVLNLISHPVISTSHIQASVQAASFQLPLLPPQTRVLALCIIAVASLTSFHEAVLGPGPRPASLTDPLFFSANSRADVRHCGTRRAPVCRALHAAALRAAWDAGTILHVSVENAASCFLFDILDHTDSSTPSRPWACAYISHVRAIAPLWRSTNATVQHGHRWESPPYSGQWTAFIMAEALMSTRDRKPTLITLEDQLLLYGSDPPSAEEVLAAMEASTKKPDPAVLLEAAKPYLFHITRMARQLWTTINGDLARVKLFSESAVLSYLSSLSLIHAILSHMLSHGDLLLAASPPLSANDHHDLSGLMHGLVMGFTSLVLPVYRELEFRVNKDDPDDHTRERMTLLIAQTREMMGLAVRELARSVRCLPSVHYSPLLRLLSYAQFALEDAEVAPMRDPLRVADLATIAGQISIVAYSHEFTSPEVALLQRLDRYLENPVVESEFINPQSLGMPGDLLDQAWMGMDFLPLPDGLEHTLG